ncbi:MAG: hypothetical protein LUE20_00555 [Oscillospiraceae bacterium]|nr:hypothetical protein [Oscillospiraceae bacterium]
MDNNKNLKDIVSSTNDWENEIYSNMLDALNPIDSISPTIASKSIDAIIDTISNSIQQTMKSINPFLSFAKEILSDFASQLSSIVEQIQIPNISEERKKELTVRFKTWGKYGWTLMPNTDITSFDSSPADLDDANRMAKSWCTRGDIEQLFEYLHDVKGVKKSDLKDAIFLYRSRQYKPCAMLLFSLLDAKLIRMQRNEDRDNRNRRSVGATAIKRIKDRVEREQNIDNKLFISLSYVNLFACLGVFFEDAKDFKKQPDLINRNFLQHGMLTRRVRKRDCVQLFLLYYNFLEFFEIINS